MEGINWYAKKGRLPLEFKLTQQTWEPWTIVPRTLHHVEMWCFLVEKKGYPFGKCMKDDLNTFWDDDGLGGFIFGFLNMDTYVLTDDIYIH